MSVPCYESPSDLGGARGQVAVWVKGLSSSPAHLFEGKHRKSRVTVQGRFKQPLLFDDVRPAY